MKILLIFTGILILVTPTLSIFSLQIDNIPPSHEPFIFNRLANSYAPHDPILITDEGDFTENGFIGGGTINDPYILEGLRIENSTYCVQVRNVDSIFILRNCEFVSNASGETRTSTVFFSDTFLPKIEHCSFTRGGIRVEYTVGCNISDSLISDSQYGIYFGTSDDMKIVQCLIENCPNAIRGYWSDDAYIKENEIINCGDGISTLSDATIILNKLFNISGIGIRSSSSSKIFDNNLTNCVFGLYLIQ